jgi:hypothetical protein
VCSSDLTVLTTLLLGKGHSYLSAKDYAGMHRPPESRVLM